jgi:hypothetical protein
MCSGEEQSELKAKSATKHPAVKLMYYGHAKVNIRGPVTGTLYQFSRLQPVQSVDSRDAVAILRTRLFRQVR